VPIYEYRCERGHNFEALQRMTDDPIVSCEVCSAPVQRVFHPIAVHFKGSGFYNTDYGTRKRSRELKEAGEGTGKHSGDGGSSSDSSSSSDSGSSASEGKGDSKKSDGQPKKPEAKKPAAKSGE
jgi:putative FmdB family regulatory protein